MRHLMTAALAITLMSGTSALAQPESGEHHDKGAQQGGSHGGQQGAPRQAPAQQAAPAGQRGGPGGAPAYQGGARPSGGYQGYQGYQGGTHGAQGAAAPQGGHTGAPAYQGYQGGAHNAQGGFQGGQGGARVAHGVPNTYSPRFGAPGVRPGGPRPHYDAQFFPRVFRPDHAFAWRGGYWRPQPGFYYRHWVYGERLPFGWFDAQWYINDYYYYDLPVPPYGYEWIRSGPDALLVDLNDGTVVEAVYGLFY